MDNFFGIGSWELIVIGLIALIVLGPKQMILLARKAGEYLRQFQVIWQEASRTLDKEVKALETEAGGSIGELGREIQNLEKELKAAVNKTISLDGIISPPGAPASPVQPPPSPAPPIPATPPTPTAAAQPPNGPAPEPPGDSAHIPWSARDAGATPPPGHSADRLPDHPTKYPAWTTKPEN